MFIKLERGEAEAMADENDAAPAADLPHPPPAPPATLPSDVVATRDISKVSRSSSGPNRSAELLLSLSEVEARFLMNSPA